MSATQRARILQLLAESRGEWVPAVELSKISLQYNARVKEIRAAGHEVESRVERVRTNGRSFVKHSWFRLCTARQNVAAKIGRGEHVSSEEFAAALKNDGDQPSLFSEPLRAQHRDEG